VANAPGVNAVVAVSSPPLDVAACRRTGLLLSTAIDEHDDDDDDDDIGDDIGCNTRVPIGTRVDPGWWLHRNSRTPYRKEPVLAAVRGRDEEELAILILVVRPRRTTRYHEQYGTYARSGWLRFRMDGARNMKVRLG